MILSSCKLVFCGDAIFFDKFPKKWTIAIINKDRLKREKKKTHPMKTQSKSARTDYLIKRQSNFDSNPTCEVV